MFRPADMGLPVGEGEGLHEMVRRAVMACEPLLSPGDLRGLWRGVVLGGGNMALPGMRDQLKDRLQAMAGDAKVKVSMHSKSVVWSAFRGGARLVAGAMEDDLWTTASAFREGRGPRGALSGV